MSMTTSLYHLDSPLLRWKRWLPAGLLAAAVFVLMSAIAQAAPWQQEEAIDQQLGLLDHPFKINRVRLNLRSFLPAQVRPGFPPYKQQPEGFRASSRPGGAGFPSGNITSDIGP